MKKRWEILRPDPEIQNTIRKTLGCHPITAAVLANRDRLNPAGIRDFWSPSLQALRPPFALQDIQKAVERISAAIESKQKILIFGDYDVDGVTATVILLEFLQHAGALVDYFIPHRLHDGYGLRARHIMELAAPRGIKLIITVDCGSTDHAAVAVANAAGIQVIITDHHQIPADIPDAAAVVNPKRLDCSAGLAHLSGVGVTFYLIMALRKHLRDRRHWQSRSEPNLKAMCDLISLGTIADMVPLIHENRILSKIGLELIGAGNRPGLKALINASRIGRNNLGSDDVAFRLAPRLNAAGRMDHADLAVKLFLTRQAHEAEQITLRLCELNDARQVAEKKIMASIRNLLWDNPHLLEKKAIVLAHHGWHLGVLGIVAAKLVEQYGRPTILISIQEGFCKGSARSIPGFDLYQGLAACSGLLEGFGGHQMAAGLSIRPENIEDFQTQFESTVAETLHPQALLPTLLVDCELAFQYISSQLLDELNVLQPFGVDNTEPCFMARNVAIHDAVEVGGGSHRRLRISQNNRPMENSYNAILFNAGTTDLSSDQLHELVFRLRWNHWNGRKSPQMIIEDIRPMGMLKQPSDT